MKNRLEEAAYNIFFEIWPILIPVFLLAVGLLPQHSEAAEASIITADAIPKTAPTAERWGFSYENDVFIPGGRDQDYTYGISFSYTKASLLSSASHAPLDTINKILPLTDKAHNGGIEVGFYGFTPEDIEHQGPNHNDRPFSSLVYLNTSTEQLSRNKTSVIRTQLTYGILGLNLVGRVQSKTHELINGDTPNGWQHQVSNGGEPTLRYALSRQSLINQNRGRTEWRQTQAVSVGYITEASWGLSFRTGRLNSQWHTFSPELASYAESSANIHKSCNEWFFWGGISVKARAYNVFLQGQFKNSEVTYGGSELNHLILEGWLGFTKVFSNGYYASYGIRGHSSEVKAGQGNRSVLWGGLLIGKRIQT